MKIQVKADIAAPADTVFGVMTDIARWPDFIRALESVEMLTPGPAGVGTRFRETRTMFGRKATEEMTVAEMMPPSRFVLTAENHGARYEAVHEVMPIPNGSRLILTFGGEPVSLAARLFAFMSLIFAGQVRKQLQADLEDLKAEAERRGAQ